LCMKCEEMVREDIGPHGHICTAYSRFD
jgi:hypothetical protein